MLIVVVVLFKLLQWLMRMAWSMLAAAVVMTAAVVLLRRRLQRFCCASVGHLLLLHTAHLLSVVRGELRQQAGLPPQFGLPLSC